MSVRAMCRTNLDEYKKYAWPTLFVAVPRGGELVESESGQILRVVGVTHRSEWLAGTAVPSILVELHYRK